MIAIITSIATLLVALLGLFSSKKLSKKGPPPMDQAKLITTLKDTLIAQTERINLLEAGHREQIGMIEAKENEIIDLKRRVSNLEQLTIEQASIIAQLTSKKLRGGETNT